MDNSIRLLLVEDNPDEAELLTLELRSAGFQLDWTRVDNADDLRRELTQGAWDMIISDFSMPKFDGLRAFGLAQELRRDVPFIFVSGALGEERAVQAIRAGARDYIVKTRLELLPAIVRRELSLPKAEPSQRSEGETMRAPELDAIARFAHDINNHLAVILSYGRFAQRGLEVNSTPFDDVQKVLEAAHLVEELTKEMLALSRNAR